MRTQIKIQGKCVCCNSKNLYYGKVIGMSSNENYLLCQNCGRDLNFREINHRRIKVEDNIQYIERSSSHQISEAFNVIFKRLESNNITF